MNKLIDKINELHPVLEYSDYSELMDLAYELQEKYRQLHEATADIPLDRLKEICDAVRLIGQKIYEIQGKSKIVENEATHIIVEKNCISVQIERTLPFGKIEGGFEIGYEEMDNIFYGENAKERVEQRLKELREDIK